MVHVLEGFGGGAVDLALAAAEVRAEKAELEVAKLRASLADCQAQRRDTAALLERLGIQNAELRGRLCKADDTIAELTHLSEECQLKHGFLLDATMATVAGAAEGLPAASQSIPFFPLTPSAAAPSPQRAGARSPSRVSWGGAPSPSGWGTSWGDASPPGAAAQAAAERRSVLEERRQALERQTEQARVQEEMDELRSRLDAVLEERDYWRRLCSGLQPLPPASLREEQDPPVATSAAPDPNERPRPARAGRAAESLAASLAASAEVSALRQRAWELEQALQAEKRFNAETRMRADVGQPQARQLGRLEKKLQQESDEVARLRQQVEELGSALRQQLLRRGARVGELEREVQSLREAEGQGAGLEASMSQRPTSPTSPMSPTVDLERWAARRSRLLDETTRETMELVVAVRQLSPVKDDEFAAS
mmetsp:Transcript_40619/g.130709  ORF Transcript_40619/g.130709 Transcript_40619/m.130709 type:complete len:424 (+) Transcript_40619:107-1378(+)